MKKIDIGVFFGLILILMLACPAVAADWPQWRGPDRDMKSKESGLLKKWPAGGPKLLWSYDKIGEGQSGWSTVSVCKGKIYITGAAEGTEYLYALDLNGNLLWKQPFGKVWSKNFPYSRSTPTVDDGLVYVVSSLYNAACFDAAKGTLKWSYDAKAKHGSKPPSWGGAESPLVADGKVIVTASAHSAALIALDKMTGKLIWKTLGLSDKSAYCSPLLVKRGKNKIIVTVTEANIIGVDLSSGEVLWKVPYKGKYSAHPNTPLYSDGLIFVTSGYDCHSIVLKMSADGTSVKEVWRGNDLDTHHGNLVLVDGYVYGANWLNNSMGNWLCVDLKTGNVKYNKEWMSKGSLTYADGMLYCYDEKKGNVGLVKASPLGFVVESTFRFKEGQGPYWAHPVVCSGRLYLRHGSHLNVYDISAK